MSNVWLYDLVGSDKKENIKSELKFISCSSKEIGKFEIFDCQDNSFRFYIGMNIYD